MEQIDIKLVNEYVNENISVFHDNKIKSLNNLDLKKILSKKNPYLFKAKNINIASDLVKELLDAFLSSSEEKLFGDFLENLAIFIASKTSNGRKSTATGIDLEFTDDNTLYIVSIKSGPNWGNNAQQKKQTQDFQTAIKVFKQAKSSTNIEPILGICYGSTKTNYLNGYTKIVGQNFWYFISKKTELYTDIIEPLGYKAKQHNESFSKQHAKIINKFTEELTKDYCEDGQINWKKIVQLNSGNYLKSP